MAKEVTIFIKERNETNLVEMLFPYENDIFYDLQKYIRLNLHKYCKGKFEFSWFEDQNGAKRGRMTYEDGKLIEGKTLDNGEWVDKKVLIFE